MIKAFTVRMGDRSAIVKLLQTQLGIPADGSFGPGTLHAVKRHQAEHGLAPDGVVGPRTWATLGLAFDLGVDIHHGKRVTDWHAVAAAGVKTVCLKATEGQTFTDRAFADRVKAAKVVGLLVSAYHFARCGDVIEEAGHALAVAGDVPIDLDLESTGGLDRTELTDWAKRWIALVGQAQNRVPALYSNADYLEHRLIPGAFDDAPVWHACPGRYAGPSARFPVPVAWQYSWTGEVPGIVGNTDMDWVIRKLP